MFGKLLILQKCDIRVNDGIKDFIVTETKRAYRRRGRDHTDEKRTIFTKMPRRDKVGNMKMKNKYWKDDATKMKTKGA